jgi:hypothetical protein
LLIVAVIAGYTLLELVSRKVLHELRENCLANVHPSLSAIDTTGHAPLSKPFSIFDQKQFKSKIPKPCVTFTPVIARYAR